MQRELPFATCRALPLFGYTAPTLALLLYFLIGSSPCLHAQSQWYLRHPLPTPNGLLGATYGNGQFVAVGFFGTVLTSPDAVTWTSRLPEGDGILEDVAYGNGRFVAVGGQYDWDSTTVLTSTEGTDWTDGAPVNGFHLLRLAFANGLFVGFGITVNPDFGNLPVIVTSPDGRTWTERWRGTENFSGWPGSWPACGCNGSGSMVTVGNGTIVVQWSEKFLVSTNGLSWVEVPTGLAGNPSAHLSSGSGKFVAVGSDATAPGNNLKALVSGDGITWENLTIRENWNGEVHALGFGNGSFVIHATVNTMDPGGGWVGLPIALTSPDGRTWTEHSMSGLGFGYFGKDEIHTVSKLIHAQNTFVIVGEPQAGQAGRNNFARIFTSPDGINWTRRVGATVNSIVGAAGARGLIAIGNSGNSTVSLASTNGIEWRETQGLDGQYLSSIVYGNGVYATAGDTGIFTSPDGATWTRQTNAGGGWSRLRYGINKFLAVGGDLSTDGSFHPKFGSSSDGLVWISQIVSNNFVDAATDGKTIVATAAALILRSTDGASWVEVFRGPATWPELVAFGNGRYVAVGGYTGSRDSVLTSTDGTGWTTHARFTENAIRDLIFANGRFYAVGWNDFAEAHIFSSSDGVQWTAHATGFHPNLGNLAAGPQGLFAFGRGNVILHSPWDLVLTAPERALNGILRINVTGPPGANVQLQRGATLSDWADWQTVTLIDAPVQVQDADVAGSSQRFYRAVTR
jgi:hypothetical protein